MILIIIIIIIELRKYIENFVRLMSKEINQSVNIFETIIEFSEAKNLIRLSRTKLFVRYFFLYWKIKKFTFFKNSVHFL